MHFSLFQLPLLVASASAHIISITAPGGQKALWDGSAKADQCFWSGTSPFCAGSCDSGYSDCGTSGCGNGACCWTGYKKYCCRGSCPAVLPFLEASPDKPHTSKPHMAKGPYDDYCPPGQHILCPPQARNNEECECLDDDKTAKTAKGPYDDYCPPGQHILCPPQARNNEECECLDD